MRGRAEREGSDEEQGEQGSRERERKSREQREKWKEESFYCLFISNTHICGSINLIRAMFAIKFLLTFFSIFPFKEILPTLLFLQEVHFFLVEMEELREFWLIVSTMMK